MRELIVADKDGIVAVAILREGEVVDLRDDIPRLKPDDVLDFVHADGKLVLIISDGTFDESLFPMLGEDVKFASPSEVPVKAESWLWPLVAPASFERLREEGETAWWALHQSAQYLEAHLRFEEVSPWQRGLMLSTVKAHWEDFRRFAPGENFWGWVRKHCCNDCDEEIEWERQRKKFYEWMRAADVMMRNVEERPWITALTLDQIVAIPISKVSRCCGAIADGIFDYSLNLQRALLDSTVTNAEMNHLIALARAHEDKLPHKIVDEETGEILMVDGDGEIIEGDPGPVLDEYLPEISLGDNLDLVPPGGSGAMRVYDAGTHSLGYWRDGQWHLSFAIFMREDGRMDDETRRWLEEIIIRTRVRADYGQDDI